MNTRELIGIMQQIDAGYKEYKENEKRDYSKQVSRGIGTKRYLTKRIDLVREELLELKKSL